MTTMCGFIVLVISIAFFLVFWKMSESVQKSDAQAWYRFWIGVLCCCIGFFGMLLIVDGLGIQLTSVGGK